MGSPQPSALDLPHNSYTVFIAGVIGDRAGKNEEFDEESRREQEGIPSINTSLSEFWQIGFNAFECMPLLTGNAGTQNLRAEVRRKFRKENNGYETMF